MKRFRMGMVWALMGLLSLGVCTFATAEVAPWYLEQAGRTHGICVVIVDGDSNPALEVVAKTSFLVHLLARQPGAVQSALDAAETNKWSQDRLIAENWGKTSLPHADNTVDLVLGFVAETPELATEAERVLSPGGKAVFGLPQPGTFRVKPAQAGVDNWTHWEHSPDNNPVSNDTVIKAPYTTQWMGGPYYNTMPAITTISNGRMFTAMGHIAHHEREEPWLNTLLARNGYNGSELWRKKLPDGYMVHRSAFVAQPDTFYMIDPSGDGCLMLDPETGAEKGRVRTPEVPGTWKWIVLQDGVLYALAGQQADPGETTIVRSKMPAWSWSELSAGYYMDRVPWGFGETLLAYDLAANKVRWTHQEKPGTVDSRGLAMGGGKLFFYAPESRLGCLDAQTGKEVWLNEDPETRQLIEKKGEGLSSTPGFRSCATCVYSPDVLFYQGQTLENVVAISTADGKRLWHRPKTSSNPNVLYLDGKALVGIGPDGSTLSLDPKTGETIADLGFKKRSCARLTATPDSLFVRGWPEGVTRYDRASGKITFDGAMRPACNDGIVGANGLLYIGPWPCDCGLALIGTAGLCSAKPITAEPVESRLFYDPKPRTEDPSAVSDQDWSAHRGGNRHTGASSAELSGRLFPLWTTAPIRPFLPTAPVCASGRIYVAGDDGAVRAYDANAGLPVWTYATAGPILVAPTCWNGRVFAGSGDGAVYCLDAQSGELIWRFQAAPIERRIMLYGRLCSNWPVHTGIVIEDGTAYFAAGFIDSDGTYVYALDANTGAVRWVNDATGHLDEALRKGVSAQGTMTIQSGKLWLAGGNIMGPSPFDLKTGEYLGEKSVGTGAPRADRGEELAAFGDQWILLGGRLRYSAMENVVSPSSYYLTLDGRPVRDAGKGSVTPVWDGEDFVYLPGRESAPRAYRANELCDSMATYKDPKQLSAKWTADSLGNALTTGMALGGKYVAVTFATQAPRTLWYSHAITLIDRATGALTARQELPATPRMNGMAIDRDGRLLLALEDGRIMCFASEKAFQSYVSQVSEELKTGKRDREAGIQTLRGLLDGVHDAPGQTLVCKALAETGFDLYAEAKQNGAVRVWQITGPVPFDGVQNGIDKAWIGEPDIDLARPIKTDSRPLAWIEYRTQDAKGKVNLVRILGEESSVAAYAYTEIQLPEAGNYVVKIGSNDGVKAWFNGQEIDRQDVARGYRADEDECPVTAKAGKNTLLLKVTQLGGRWHMGARIAHPNGLPVVFEQ